MTNEECRTALKRIAGYMCARKDFEALTYAMNVLEQEPIIDKIRDEIDLEKRIQVKHYTNTDAVIDAVLEVIDKYKAETEGT